MTCEEELARERDGLRADVTALEVEARRLRGRCNRLVRKLRAHRVEAELREALLKAAAIGSKAFGSQEARHAFGQFLEAMLGAQRRRPQH